MLVKYPKQKTCVCGRTENHEHKTKERYCIRIEYKNNDIIDEIFMHGYDKEDDNITEFLREVKAQNPNTTAKYWILRTDKV